VDRYLTDLTSQSHDAEDQRVAAHINQIFHSFWWGLFACYDSELLFRVEGLPRTNNELERCIRQIKMGYRRVSGRKNVHDFVIRYGAYAALVDDTESLDELLTRLEEVEQEEFLKERKRLNLTLLDEAKVHRFRFHRELPDRSGKPLGSCCSPGLSISCQTNLYPTFAATVFSRSF
jgi:hypothetical protein